MPDRERGPLESWARLDPSGVATTVVRVCKRVPGVTAVEERVVAPVEKWLLQAARLRMRQVLDEADDRGRRPGAAERFNATIAESLRQTPGAGREVLYRSVLDSLVHDEVRVLAALATGDVYPLVHVSAGSGTTVLENASTVGRMAGVVLPDRTPLYVTRLLGLGLAETGPHDTALKNEYELLLTEPYVVSARARADEQRRVLKARLVKQTLRASEFGVEFWSACNTEPNLSVEGSP